MNIGNINPNIGEMMGVKSANKPAADLTNYKGPSFAASLKGVAQSANIQVADGSAAAALNLQRHKEDKLDKLFSFTEVEEEQLDESLDKIKQLMAALKKNR